MTTKRTRQDRPREPNEVNEPGRTGGKAEGREADVRRTLGEDPQGVTSQHSERESRGEEPGKTPGQAEG